MADNPTIKPSNGNEKMAAQINEIYSKFHMVQNLLADLTPAIEKISKDLQPTIKDLRVKYERDETLDLIMKVGDSIPTFVQLLDMMKIAQGMLQDLGPVVAKVADDAQPVIKDMRERFEREETIELLRKVGDNIPLFLQLFDMMKIAQGMLADMMPVVGKVMHDAQPVIKDVRERFEREETLELLNKVGDNIPLFLQLFDMIKIAQGMLADMMPVVGKVMHDAQPVIKDVRERFEREETLELLNKVGDNIPLFLQLFDLMKIAQGMLGDMIPVVSKVMHDAQPVIKDVRERFEREETIELIKKVGDNIPFFLTMMDLLNIGKGMFADLMPAVGKISHDVGPAINMLREKFEREETLTMLEKVGDDVPVLILLLDLLGKPEMNDLLTRVNENLKLLQKVGELLPVFDNLMSFLQQFNQSGTLTTATNMLLSKDVSNLVKGIDKCLETTMADIKASPVKPGIKNLIAAVLNPEVQKTLIILTKFAKYFPRSFEQAMQENK